MNFKTGLVLLIALVAGVLGGTAAYQVATPTSSSAEAGARESIVVKKGDRGRDKRPGFAPCRRPATLQGGRCVTEVTETVVVPAAAPPPSSGTGGRAPAPAPVPFHASGDDHEGRHHGGEGEDGHHGDDDDDDRDDDDSTDDADGATDTATDTVSRDVTDTHGDDDGGTQTRTRTHG